MREHHEVRITVTLDDDVLRAARALSAHDGRSLGTVLSDLARRGLGSASQQPGGGAGNRRFPVMGPGPAAGRVTTERVADLLDAGVG